MKLQKVSSELNVVAMPQTALLRRYLRLRKKTFALVYSGIKSMDGITTKADCERKSFVTASKLHGLLVNVLIL